MSLLLLLDLDFLDPVLILNFLRLHVLLEVQEVDDGSKQKLKDVRSQGKSLLLG